MSTRRSVRTLSYQLYKIKVSSKTFLHFIDPYFYKIFENSQGIPFPRAATNFYFELEFSIYYVNLEFRFKI